MTGQIGTANVTASTQRQGRFVTAAMVLLVGAGAWFRLVHLSWMPGISGDEGWWGIQALAWLSRHPYETRTTSGNPTDLFFLVPVAALHAVAPPSFALLRAVPAAVNLLALPVGFAFVRRLYGNATASAYTVTLAVLPTVIAHSRICQDPSQTVFWTGLVVYLSLLGYASTDRTWVYAAAAVLVFPIALWTHPTNVFIAPFLVLPLAVAVRRLLSARYRPAVLVAGSAILLAAAIGVSTAVRHITGPIALLDKPWLALAAARLADPGQWLEFAVNNARLFNGVTVYHYFSGAYPRTAPYDAAFVVVAVAALAGLCRRALRDRSTDDAGLLAACTATWLAFYAFAGPQALRPHAERWGLCLIVPGALVFARGLTAWTEWKVGLRPWAVGAGLLVALGLLASFFVNYLEAFRTTGGRSHFTYVTANPEPKQQAFEYILARSGGTSVTIVAQQWWIERPLAYLATTHAGVSVRAALPTATDSSIEEALRAGRLFFVEFVGTPELAKAAEWARERGLHLERRAIAAADGRHHLEVLQAAPPR